MIIDFDIDIKNIDSQPEVIGIEKRIAILKAKRADKVKKYQATGFDRILVDIDEIDKDLALFESVLYFWIKNIQALTSLKEIYLEKAKDFNEKATLYQVIEDLKMIIESHDEYTSTVNELLLKAYESKMDTEKMKVAFDRCSLKTRDFLRMIDGKIQNTTAT